MMDDREINALVIGRSGHGKSSFILSIMDGKQRSMIPASGNGQTTRSSMEYHIFNDKDQPLEIRVKLKTKKEFVDERMCVVVDFFSDTDKAIEKMCGKNSDVFLKRFKNRLIHNNAFFNCEEFGLKESDFPLGEDKDIFSNDFWKKIDAEELEDGKQEALFSKIESYLGTVYDKCKEKVTGNLEFSFNDEELKMDPDSKAAFKQEIGKFFKVMEDSSSYSSLVKKIEVFARISEEYSELMSKYRLGKMVLIDTYGLDHNEQMDDTRLKVRYENMLRNDYKNIQTVFYLRNIASNDSPSDISKGISTLFKVEPSVHPYIIFTYWDEFKKQNMKLENSKAYRDIMDLPTEILPVLIDADVSRSLAESRMNELKNTVATYASVGIEDGCSDKDIQEYYDHNRDELEKIIKSILHKAYLGNALIPIASLKQNEAIKKALLADGLFKSVDLNNYPSATKGAIRRRIEPEYGRILGFSSSTRPSVLWSDLIANDLNSRFTGLDDEWKENMTGGCINAIEELFVRFSRNLYRGTTNVVDLLDTTTYGNQITGYLYDDRKKIIDRPYYPVGEYLSDIYAFDEIGNKTKEKISDTFSKAFDSIFIPMCRKYNAQKLAEMITDHTTYSEKEEMLLDYYNNFDPGLLNSASEREEFEITVSDELEV